jgi:hypothetical protein
MNKHRGFWLVSVAGLVAGCAARSVPGEFPQRSAASNQADEAPLSDVTVSLRSDPPLPGESTQAWSGLRPTKERSGASTTHHHHEQGAPDAPAIPKEHEHAH